MSAISNDVPVEEASDVLSGDAGDSVSGRVAETETTVSDS